MRGREGSVLVDVVLALLLVTLWMVPSLQQMNGNARVVRALEVELALESLASGILDAQEPDWYAEPAAGELPAEYVGLKARQLIGGLPPALSHAGLVLELSATPRWLTPDGLERRVRPLVVLTLDARWTQPGDPMPKRRRFVRICGRGWAE